MVVTLSFQWALIFLGLKQYLRPSGNSGEGRLDFYHRTISKVVRNVYMENEADTRKWHTRLADFFENWYVGFHLTCVSEKKQFANGMICP